MSRKSGSMAMREKYRIVKVDGRWTVKTPRFGFHVADDIVFPSWKSARDWMVNSVYTTSQPAQIERSM